jgi:hypothetical protein
VSVPVLKWLPVPELFAGTPLFLLGPGTGTKRCHRYRDCDIFISSFFLIGLRYAGPFIHVNLHSLIGAFITCALLIFSITGNTRAQNVSGTETEPDRNLPHLSHQSIKFGEDGPYEKKNYASLSLFYVSDHFLVMIMWY